MESCLPENRLEAEVSGGMTRCCICEEYTRAIHWHHTVPRSLGGELSLQIPVDGDCHTALHAKGSAIVSALKGNRKAPIGQFWSDPVHESNADPWLSILVEAMLNPPIAPEDKMTLLPAISVDGETRNALELLKRDTPGITNIADTLRFCIEYTIRNKGLKNEKGKNKRTARTSIRRNDLW